MQNLSKRIGVKVVSNKKKDYIECTSKPIYMLRKIFDNKLVVIRKNKATLTLKKLVYIRICISELSKVLLYESHYDYMVTESKTFIHRH